MSGVAVNLIIAAIIIGVVTLVDFSVFFISKDTENLLYYDENSIDEDSSDADEDVEESEKDDEEKSEDDVVQADDNKHGAEISSDDFILDIDEMTKEFVSSVKEDAR